MAKWDLSKIENCSTVGDYIDEDDTRPDQPTPLMIVRSINRKADIMRMDAGRGPERRTMKQRAEEIMSLCSMLEKAPMNEQMTLPRPLEGNGHHRKRKDAPPHDWAR
jgi:hypothetical protein